MYNLDNRAVVLGVTGSIAAYKAVDLASKLTQVSAIVDVAMTEEATRFVAPLTFRGVTGRPVYADMFDAPSEIAEAHVALARRAEIVVIAPATATMLARLAHGSAEDMVSLTTLATVAPVIVCPAMDNQMWEHPATQANVALLKERGTQIVEPEVGRLASGQEGAGRLPETETIMGAIRYTLGRRGDLAGRRIVVSAGGTKEPIDPVRYIGNYSSGKMGYAVAEAARDRGANVALVSSAALPPPYGVRVVPVRRAEEMRDAVVDECEGADAVVMAAAVADFKPAVAAEQKMKRGDREDMAVELTRTPDILKEVGEAEGLIKVGFAAESHDLLANAREKVRTKGLHFIAANDITVAGAGFESDTNRIILVDRDGGFQELPLLSKYEVAQRLLDRLAALLRNRR